MLVTLIKYVYVYMYANLPLQKGLPWCTSGYETWFTRATLIEIGVYRGSIIRVGVAFYITFCFACLFDCLLENYFQINVKDNVLDKVTTSYCFSELCVKIAKIHRGIYYTVARRYEFYLRVAKQYFTTSTASE